MAQEQLAERSLVEEYLVLPRKKLATEFWSPNKINYIRSLASTGTAQRVWTPSDELSSRILDRVEFKAKRDARSTGIRRRARGRLEIQLARGRIPMKSPLYLGDMSFGALSGIPNIALARVADDKGILTGTGEGGLHPEVAQSRRITVQWASARFGVNLEVLQKGLAVVIKIGQGAKPGIGGHLPANKVTEEISLVRKVPRGRDAISPAPHHDIYSIEDLGQRIAALKLVTGGKPVFVKVGATNYVPYIASGVARMGADGIILDGHGAGTGAAPEVVRDNVGIPIELAVASAHNQLVKENLRNGFSIIAAGLVSNPEDSAKLIALGADAVSLGTAALISMGCIMVHRCHIGLCPAYLTNKMEDKRRRILSIMQATGWLSNLIEGWNAELRLILDELQLDTIRDLVGRSDLLRGFDLSEETMKVMNISGSPRESRPIWSHTSGADLWNGRRVAHLQSLALTGEAVIASMGSTAAPFVEQSSVVTDWLRCDGAQVTRPSIDPYREEIETQVYLLGGRVRASIPVYLRETENPRFSSLARTACRRMGIPFQDLNSSLRLSGQFESPIMIHHHTDTISHRPTDRRGYPEPMLVRMPVSDRIWEVLVGIAQSECDGLMVRGEQGMDIAVAIASIDKHARRITGDDGLPMRSKISLFAEGPAIRGADDVFKLMALGADCVDLTQASLTAVGPNGENEAREIEKLENFIFGIQKEIKLLAGAAGISQLYGSLVGNRELLRSVDIDGSVGMQLGVKPAGVG